jgi:hypothetical protein
MACVVASVQYIPPFFLMEGQLYNYNYESCVPPRKKSYIQRAAIKKLEEFSQFLDQFIETKPSGPVILLPNDRGSCCTDPSVLKKKPVNDVFLLCSLPHCTRKLHPLDVIFGPLETF